MSTSTTPYLRLYNTVHALLKKYDELYDKRAWSDEESICLEEKIQLYTGQQVAESSSGSMNGTAGDGYIVLTDGIDKCLVSLVFESGITVGSLVGRDPLSGGIFQAGQEL